MTDHTHVGSLDAWLPSPPAFLVASAYQMYQTSRHGSPFAAVSHAASSQTAPMLIPRATHRSRYAGFCPSAVGESCHANEGLGTTKQLALFGYVPQDLEPPSAPFLLADLMPSWCFDAAEATVQRARRCFTPGPSQFACDTLEEPLAISATKSAVTATLRPVASLPLLPTQEPACFTSLCKALSSPPSRESLAAARPCCAGEGARHLPYSDAAATAAAAAFTCSLSAWPAACSPPSVASFFPSDGAANEDAAHADGADMEADADDKAEGWSFPLGQCLDDDVDCFSTASTAATKAGVNGHDDDLSVVQLLLTSTAPEPLSCHCGADRGCLLATAAFATATAAPSSNVDNNNKDNDCINSRCSWPSLAHATPTVTCTTAASTTFTTAVVAAKAQGTTPTLPLPPHHLSRFLVAAAAVGCPQQAWHMPGAAAATAAAEHAAFRRGLHEGTVRGGCPRIGHVGA